MIDYHFISYKTHKYVWGELKETTQYAIVEINSLKEYSEGLFSFTGILVNQYIPIDEEIRTIMNYVDSLPMSGFSNIKIIKTI